MAAVTDDFVKKCEVKQNDTLGRWVLLDSVPHYNPFNM